MSRSPRLALTCLVVALSVVGSGLGVGLLVGQAEATTPSERARLLDGLALVTSSATYRAFAEASPVDARKVALELAGTRRPTAGSQFARGLIEAARVAYLPPAPPPTTTTQPPPPPPPPPPARLAPQTYNPGSSGQDSRYCVRWPGVTNIGPNRWRDEGGFTYDDNGLGLGGRSRRFVSGLKPADQMDGRDACDPYDGLPPYPAASFLP